MDSHFCFVYGFTFCRDISCVNRELEQGIDKVWSTQGAVLSQLKTGRSWHGENNGGFAAGASGELQLRIELCIEHTNSFDVLDSVSNCEKKRKRQLRSQLRLPCRVVVDPLTPDDRTSEPTMTPICRVVFFFRIQEGRFPGSRRP